MGHVNDETDRRVPDSRSDGSLLKQRNDKSHRPNFVLRVRAHTANVALNRRAPEVRVILPDRSLLRLRIKTNLYAAAESRNASVSSAGSCARGVLATMHTLS